MKQTVILDTNMLLVPSIYNVDIFTEVSRIVTTHYIIAVVKLTITELEELASRNDRQARAAKLALQMLKKFNVEVLPSNRKVFKRADEAIIEIADRNYIIVTQDYELRKAVREKGAQTIILRQKNHLVLE